MTPEKKAEKKRWREHKRTLRKLAAQNLTVKNRLGLTANQVKQDAKRIVDQLLAGRNPQYAVAKGDERGEGLVQIW